MSDTQRDSQEVGLMAVAVDALSEIGLCPDWPQMNPKNAIDNAKKAMDAAEKWLDVPQVRTGNLWLSR